MNKSRLYILAAAGIIAAAAGGVALTRRAHPGAATMSSAPVRPALTVQTVQAETGRVSLHLKASGNIAAWQDISIASQNTGLRLAEVRVNVGDRVRKGQVLAVFAADTVQAEVLQAQANVLAAEAQAADARANAERARSIADTGALSQQQIHQMETAAKATAAQVQAARALLQIQKTRQGYARVLAPDDGVISARNATVGAVIAAGTEMFRMVRQGRLEWRAEVSGQELQQVQAGQEAAIVTSAGTAASGRVRSVSPTLDPVKRVGVVYVDLINPPQGVRAGMYASGNLMLGQAQGLLVPQSTVVARDGFDYVFVVTPENKVQQRQVELGARVDDKVQVLKGLDAGTALVRSGAGFLVDGDVVSVAPAQAGVASAPASAASLAQAAASGQP